MPKRGLARHILIWGLISLDLAVLVTNASFRYITFHGFNEFVGGSLWWPFGSGVKIRSWDEVPDSEVTSFWTIWAAFLCKYSILIALPGWLGWRRVSPLASRRIAQIVACVTPFFLVVLLELAPARERSFSDGISPGLAIWLGLTDVVLLLGIARLRSHHLLRMFYSLPCWLAWVAWAGLRMHEVHLTVVSVIGLALYALSLDGVAGSDREPVGEKSPSTKNQ